MKRKLPVLITLLLFSFVFQNCSKDEVASPPEEGVHEDPLPVSDTYSHSGLYFENLNYSDLENDKVFKNLSAQFQLDESIKSFEDSQVEILQDLYGFEIDTNHIKVVTKENYISYTFKIERDYQSRVGFIENLMVENNNGIERAFIISYIPDMEMVVRFL